MSVAAARAQKRFNWYVFRSWRILTLLAAVVLVLLLMTALQTFCSVYLCKTWFGSVFQIPQAGGTAPFWERLVVCTVSSGKATAPFLGLAHTAELCLCVPPTQQQQPNESTNLQGFTPGRREKAAGRRSPLTR